MPHAIPLPRSYSRFDVEGLTPAERAARKADAAAAKTNASNTGVTSGNGLGDGDTAKFSIETDAGTVKGAVARQNKTDPDGALESETDEVAGVGSASAAVQNAAVQALIDAGKMAGGASVVLLVAAVYEQNLVRSAVEGPPGQAVLGSLVSVQLFEDGAVVEVKGLEGAQRVTIRIPVSKAEMDALPLGDGSERELRCAYLGTDGSGNDQWRTDGCAVTTTPTFATADDVFLVCSCSHLTDFSALANAVIATSEQGVKPSDVRLNVNKVRGALFWRAAWRGCAAGQAGRSPRPRARPRHCSAAAPL